MNFRTCFSSLSVLVLLPLSLFGKCPISPNGTLELRAPAGNLIVDTSGTDSVEVEVSNRQVTLEERCEANRVIVTTKTPNVAGVPDWKIRVPRGVSLDLSTQGGSIQVGDTDGSDALLRTSGGKVTTGNIKGNALIHATEVKTGNIGGNAELRGLGGRLQVGDVGGNAEFFTKGGDITTGRVSGRVKAESESGSITIRESNGDVLVSTREGDITSNYIHGAFDGKTESGNIRLERVGSWVHAFTGVGDIFVRMVPENLGGDLHVNTGAGLGNITMYVPQKIKATIDAIIDKPAMKTKQIISDFPFKAVVKAPIEGIRSLLPGGPEKQGVVINGGGNSIKLRTSAGTIHILKGN
jgi:hypothetical protein